MNEEPSSKNDQLIAASQISLETATGKALNERWDVHANHALYHHNGRWYHRLNRFPGALFDRNGYVVFETEEAFRNSPYLAITQDVHVPGGISTIPGYKRQSSEDNESG